MPRKIRTVFFTIFCCLVLSFAFFQAPTECHSFGIEIDIVPNTLNIQSQGKTITAQTNIVYNDVDHENVYLNGISINSWEADSGGYFVAKFLMTEVKALADSGDLDVPGENELSLVGYTTEQEEFTGSQTITVINIIPAGADTR